MKKGEIFNFEKIFKNLKRAIACEKGDKKEVKRLKGIGLKLKKVEQIAKKRERGEKLTEKDIKKAQFITCYGNIGYCCGLEKPCIQRDACREALGIDNKIYKKVKEQVVYRCLVKE